MNDKKPLGMYANVIYQGHSLLEWRTLLKNEFSLGELYRMAQDGVDFGPLVKI